MDDLPVTDRITIPGAELEESFVRSGGPGGQNVNKVATKVELRWRPGQSAAFTEPDREWILKKLGTRLTGEGELIVTSSRTRDQGRNREDARAKLAAMISAALERPKRRRRTKPGRQAIERRLREKKERAEVKERRRDPNWS